MAEVQVEEGKKVQSDQGGLENRPTLWIQRVGPCTTDPYYGVKLCHGISSGCPRDPNTHGNPRKVQLDSAGSSPREPTGARTYAKPVKPSPFVRFYNPHQILDSML